MSQLTFVSTTSTPEQMAADLGVSTPADASRVPAGSTAAVVVADEPAPVSEGAAALPDTPETPPAGEPATTEAKPPTPAPAAESATPGETTGEEYPELGGMTPEDFARLPHKTQRRIAKLTRKLRETEAENQALKGPRTPVPAPVAATPSTPPGTVAPEPSAAVPETPADDSALPPGFRPKPESDAFETWAEFEEALVDWKIDLRDARRAQAAEKAETERRQQAAKQAVDATLTAFTTRRDQVKAERPDWDEVVTNDPIQTDDPRKLADLERLVVEALDADGQPIGPEVLYHLGKNRADLDRLLASATPMQMAMRFGAVLTTVEASRANGNGSAPAAVPPARPAPKVTSAPAPVRPVAGASAVTPSDLDDSLPQAEWERRREAQLQARSGGTRR